MIDFFSWLYEFLTTGIYNLLTDAFAYYVEVTTVTMLNTAIVATAFAWDVAQVIISDLNLSEFLESTWSNFDSQTIGIIQFFKVPEAFNLILSATVTRYVLNFVPFV